ncbi:MAG TPA: hypothetical protein VGX92_15285 [Pyrinomonadaceae bacterium]|jgi:hypothetical protein|nr:hypothetical protein [Pyrinomonadaceae bacterium]
MRFRLGGIALSLFIALSLVGSFTVDAPQAKAEPANRQGGQSSAVVFVVSARSLPTAAMEPILIIEQGKYKNPIAGDSDPEEIARFATEYYRKGAEYRVLFGGGRAGTLTVKASTRDEECFRTGAEVTLRSKARLNSNVMALATNSDSLGRAGEGSRRAPTASERAAILPLARNAFRQKGVPAALLPTLQTVNLTAFDLDGDGKAELAGTFVVKKRKGGQQRYVLFLLAEPQNDGYRAVVTEYASYTEKDIMSGGNIDAIGTTGIYTERLVDQLDLNADGASEVITITDGFESVTYMIYGKQNGRWGKVYEFASYRCAF